MNTPSATGGTPEGWGTDPTIPPQSGSADNPGPVAPPSAEQATEPLNQQNQQYPAGYPVPGTRLPTPPPGYVYLPPGYIGPHGSVYQAPGYGVPATQPVQPPGQYPNQYPNGNYPPQVPPPYLPPRQPLSPQSPPLQTVQKNPGSTRDTVTTVVSWLGAAILILGLIFLTAQAVHRGWLGPLVAVVAAAVISVAIIGVALVTHHRSPDNPVSAALLTVGVLGLLSDIWVTVFGLEWTDARLGTVLAALICAVGLGIARWWEQQWLAFTLLITGALLIFPTGIGMTWDDRDITVLAGSLIALGVLGWASTWNRSWTPVECAAAPVFIAGLLLAAPDGLTLEATIGSLVAIAVVTVLSLTPTTTSSAAAMTTALLCRWIPASLIPVLLLLGSDGDLFDGLHTREAARWCALAVAVLTCAVPIVRQLVVRESLVKPQATQPVATVFDPQRGIVRLAPAEPPTIEDAMRPALAIGLFGLALTLISNYASSSSCWWLCGLLLVTGMVIWASPWLPAAFSWILAGFTVVSGLHLLVPGWNRDIDVDRSALWLPAALYLVLAALSFYRSAALGLTFITKIIAGGVLLILGSTAVPLAARAIDDTDAAFMTGHLIISVAWMLLGVFFLLRIDARIGLAVTLLATAKLVLYDLAALDGLIQVAAFILCGIILLVSAVLRDRGQRQPTPPTD